MERYKKMYTVFICICITESLFCTPETSTTLQINHMSILKKSQNETKTKISSQKYQG